MTEKLKDKLRKFTADPDWVLIETMFNEHMDPLKSIMTIDVNRSNDEIASEVRGRQLTIESLTKFLKDSNIVNSQSINQTTTFK